MGFLLYSSFSLSIEQPFSGSVCFLLSFVSYKLIVSLTLLEVKVASVSFLFLLATLCTLLSPLSLLEVNWWLLLAFCFLLVSILSHLSLARSQLVASVSLISLLHPLLTLPFQLTIFNLGRASEIAH